jgi:hypothetical protein
MKMNQLSAVCTAVTAAAAAAAEPRQVTRAAARLAQHLFKLNQCVH